MKVTEIECTHRQTSVKNIQDLGGRGSYPANNGIKSFLKDFEESKKQILNDVTILDSCIMWIVPVRKGAREPLNGEWSRRTPLGEEEAWRDGRTQEGRASDQRFGSRMRTIRQPMSGDPTSTSRRRYMYVSALD